MMPSACEPTAAGVAPSRVLSSAAGLVCYRREQPYGGCCAKAIPGESKRLGVALFDRPISSGGTARSVSMHSSR